MDNMLIDFWRKHECLFNSSVDSYFDKDLKGKLWSDFASSIGKPVSDVERRSRSLRTQYGRVLWHPERVSTLQQKMLREKLDFLRPYIVRRRSDSCQEEKFDDQEEDEEELETEGSIDQEMGSSFGSPLDADATEQGLDDEPQFVVSTLNIAPLHCPKPQPQVTGVVSLSSPRRHSDDASADQPAKASEPDILNQFAEVMLADMRHIKDPVVLMRLRRDITDLVFRAVEEDVQKRCIRAPLTPPRACSQANHSWRQRFLKRRSKESGRRTQRWDEMRHTRRTSRSQSMQPVQQSEAPEGTRETELHTVKIEEEALPLA